MYNKPLVFIDIETTGGSLLQDRIIEIGLLRVEKGKIVKTYETLVNPDTPLSPFIENLTGINTNELSRAPVFAEIKEELLDILEGAVFVAHNVRFDYGFIKHEFSRLGINYSAKQCCTVKLSRYLYPQYLHHNLDSIMSRFNIPCVNRHRALADATVMWKFYLRIEKTFKKNIFNEALEFVMKRPSLPMALPQGLVDSLPNTPGVYIFYGDGTIPLYIGKSKHIRERVLSHFSADHSSSTEMKIAQQIKSIEVVNTAGELGALLKESTLIKTLKPIYNRKLRLTRKLVLVIERKDPDGYIGVDISIVETINPYETAEILGIFRSKKQAVEKLYSLAKEYSLCPKLLGVEKSLSTCFSYRLGHCKGACAKKESSLSYNIRIAQAFSKHKIKAWPFKGRIGIVEKNALEGENEVFILDNWCYIGSYKEDAYGARDTTENEYVFDVDLYKIFCQILLSPARQQQIHVFAPARLTG